MSSIKIFASISASSHARWCSNLPSLRCFATVSSLCFPSSGSIARHITRLSILEYSWEILCLRQTASINELSNLALCATITGLSPQNSRNCSTASFSLGALATMPSFIPVSSTIFCGIGFSGLTIILKLSTIRIFFILTAPISVNLSFSTFKPVVSTSYIIISSFTSLVSFLFIILTGLISFTTYASHPYITLKSSSPADAFIASGNACTTPWSVIAIALWPHECARLIRVAISVTASIADMFVCKWSSTRFFSALSCFCFFLTETIENGLIVISLENVSNSIEPDTITVTPFFSLSTAISSFFGSTNIFICIEPV